MEPQIWVGVLAILALVSSGVSLYLTARTGSLYDLRSQVRALDNDLTELNDRVEHWRGRDAVRKMRAGQAAALEVATPQRGTPQFKAFLRSRANSGTGGTTP